MSSSFVVCGDCGESSAAVEWGFVLLARHGWTAQLGDTGSEPVWRCPACNERLAKDGWEMDPEDFQASKRRLRLLLVDDQALVLRATASMLKELDVVTANSGADALARLGEGGHFDVIVSDVTMPNMSGPELYIRVRREFPHMATRFLLLSGDSYGASLLCSAVARREGLGQMPRILDKPVPRNELVKAVEDMARRHLPRSGTFAIDMSDAEVPTPRTKHK